MYRHDKFGFSPNGYLGEDEASFTVVGPWSGLTESQIPWVIEESYYVNRHMFPRISLDDIPQPEGKIYRGVI